MCCIFIFIQFKKFYFPFLSFLATQDLSSLTRDWTHAPWCESTVLTTGLPGKSHFHELSFFLFCRTQRKSSTYSISLQVMNCGRMGGEEEGFVFIKKYGGLWRSHPWLSYFTQGPLWIHQQMPLGLLSKRNGESGHLSAHLPQHHSLLLPLSPQPPLHPTSGEILINLVCMVLLNNQHLSFSKSKMMDICTHLLYPLLCRWAFKFRFLPCPGCCN